MGTFLPLAAASLGLVTFVAAQATTSTKLRPLAPLYPEVVLTDSADPTPLDFGLDNCGIVTSAHAPLRFGEGDSVLTPGGARIDCCSVGVKVTFPSGREVLVAPDGFVHLRTEEHAGPFPMGIELRLGDGAMVRIRLSPSERQRVQEVVVVAGDRVLQPWHRGDSASLTPRNSGWAGVHVSCCGDGGDLYRTIALGPMIVLDRILVAADRDDKAPPQRLVLLTGPMLQAVDTMQRQHREPDAAVRKVMTAVAAVADRGRMIFPAGASLQRAEKDRLRWLLRGGFELELALDGEMAPRLQLFAGEHSAPMIEWTLRADSAAFLMNPHDDQVEKRWHGNGTRLHETLMDLQARQLLFERAYALRVIDRLKR